MVTGNSTWSKQALWKKYISRSRLQCLDKSLKVVKGSPLFSLCSKALTFFSQALTWSPGNGKKIRIWEDSILGHPLVRTLEGMEGIRRHLSSTGKTQYIVLIPVG
jgi:hypothetical protein